jgi:hypothetical protein
VHGASKHLCTRPFRAEAASFVIIVAPTMQVMCMLLGLRAIIPWARPSVCLRFRLGTRLAWAVAGQKKPIAKEVVPTSEAVWVALYPPSLGLTRGKIEASTQCSRELSTCCAVAAPRMLFSCQYTSPAPLVEGASNASRIVATTATFWLSLVKVGSCLSA